MYPAAPSNIINECGAARTMNRAASESRNWQVCFFDCFQRFTRFWGVFTSVVLCGVGVDTAVHQHITGYYLIVASAMLFWLEITWVIGLFLHICIKNEQHRVLRCWMIIQSLEAWKKFIIYAPLSSVPIIWHHNLWLSYVVGGQLIALSLFHLILSFKGRRRRKQKERLFHAENDSFESSKFEEVTEVLDDGIIEPIPGSSHSLFSDNLAEQDTVLEI